MTVSITWSTSAGGTAVASLDHGSNSNGSNTTAQRIYIRHDGDNPITGCAFYFAQKTGTYEGDFDAATDFAEMLEWGDATTSNSFGGIQINMDAEGDFSGGDTWDMTESQQTSVDGLKFTVRTGVADSLSNAMTLSEKMSSSMSSDGELPNDVNDASFEIRMKIPTDEDTLGVRQFSQVLKYTYTS